MKGIVFTLCLLLSVGLASANTIYVGSGHTYTTIQSGINAASSGDTVMVVAGTYQGSANKNLDFGGRNIVLMAESGPGSVTIDCQNSGRGFYFHSAETNAAEVNGFIIKNGSSTMGGGVNCTNSSPTFKYCIIASNSSPGSYGGGVYISNGGPAFIKCTIYQNSSQYGGAMYAAGSTMELNSCIVAANTASG